MQMRMLSFVLSSVLLSGCSVQTGLAPVETVIEKGSDRDFGLEGSWRPGNNPELPHEAGNYLITVNRTTDRQSYKATLQVVGGVDADLDIHLRTLELSPDSPHAIIEIELRNDESIAHRRLAVAAVLDGKLYLWPINGQLIGEYLYEAGSAAVIEHGTFCSTIRCKPQNLLATIRKHSRDVVGSVQIFMRIPEEVK